MKHKFGWDLPPGVTHQMIEEQAGAFVDNTELRCGDCKCCKQYPEAAYCWSPVVPDPGKEVNPGWYAGKCFVYKDK